MSGAQVILEAHNPRYRPDDRSWHEQLTALYQGLRDAGLDLGRAHAPIEGAKGGLEPVIVALGASGVVTAVLRFMSDWLRLDRDRRIRLTVTGREPKVIEVTGMNISDETIRAAVEGALRRSGHDEVADP